MSYTLTQAHTWDYLNGHGAWVGWLRHPPCQTRICVNCHRPQYRYAGEITWRWYDDDGNMTWAGTEDEADE